MSLVREIDQTLSNYFSEWETKYLIYSGLVFLTYIYYLDQPTQEFFQSSLNKWKQTTFAQQLQGEQPKFKLLHLSIFLTLQLLQELQKKM